MFACSHTYAHTLNFKCTHTWPCNVVGSCHPFHQPVQEVLSSLCSNSLHMFGCELPSITRLSHTHPHMTSWWRYSSWAYGEQEIESAETFYPSKTSSAFQLPSLPLLISAPAGSYPPTHTPSVFPAGKQSFSNVLFSKGSIEEKELSVAMQACECAHWCHCGLLCFDSVRLCV